MMKKKEPRIGILRIDESINLYSLTEDDRLVYHVDSVKYGLEKQKKIELLIQLKLFCHDIEIEGFKIIKNYIRNGRIKKIVRNKLAAKCNLWEMRSLSHGGRLFFVMDDEANIIVSAVNKSHATIERVQDRAITVGVKRWQKFLKS